MKAILQSLSPFSALRNIPRITILLNRQFFSLEGMGEAGGEERGPDRRNTICQIHVSPKKKIIFVFENVVVQ